VEARKYLVEPHIPDLAKFEKWRGTRVLKIEYGRRDGYCELRAAWAARVTSVDLEA
jgi:hypothetical protein